jgi:hypothetical protein
VTRRGFALLVVFALGAAAAPGVARRVRRHDLGDLAVAPAGRDVSVRARGALRFSMTTAAPVDVTWSVWSRPMSHERTWTYAPGPDDGGWQHVTLAVTGPDGDRVERAWDVGVVPAVAPALDELLPPAGAVDVPPGERPRFRCGARAPGARPEDRLHFEWSIDDRPAQRDDAPAARAVSELVLPEAPAGPHRVAVRVTEADGAPSEAEWRVAVATVPVPAAAPPTTVGGEDQRRVTGRVGERFAFAAAVPNEPPRTRYDWAVDGRRAQRGASPRFAWVAGASGLHRVSVAAWAGRRTFARTGWTVAVR